MQEIPETDIIYQNFQHDSTSNCAPGGNEGNYIMFARATSGDQKNNRLFSPCSRSSMNGVMDVKGRCIEAKCCFKGNTCQSIFTIWMDMQKRHMYRA